MRYDRARKNLGRHPNDILAAYMASRDVSSRPVVHGWAPVSRRSSLNR